jgi:uncharacterized membrane protein
MEHTARDARTSSRTGGAILLAFLGTLSVGIGVATLFGGAWAAVVVGGVAILFALALSLPEQRMWG